MFAGLNYVHVYRNTTISIPKYKPGSAPLKSEIEKKVCERVSRRGVIGGMVTELC